MKRLILSILMVLICVISFAQPQGQRRGPGPGQRPNFDKYVQDRIAFVTKVMGLAPADSAKFVPLYKDMLKEKGELMFKRPHQRILPNQQYADSVYNNAAIGEIEYKLEDAKIEKKYLEQYQKFLTPKQVFSWIQAEKLFIGSFMRGGGPRGNRPPQNNGNKQN